MTHDRESFPPSDESKIWKERVCLLLLDRLEGLKRDRGIRSTSKFERVFGLPVNTLNRLKGLSIPTLENAQRIVENTGMGWETFGEILRRAREETSITQKREMGETQAEGDLQVDPVDALEFLQDYITKVNRSLRNRTKSDRVYTKEINKEMPQTYIAQMIQRCIEERNLTDEDIRARLTYLNSFAPDFFFSWDTFQLIRNGSRKLSDRYETRSLASVMDPEEEVFPIEQWHQAQRLDAKNGDFNSSDTNNHHS